MDTIIIENATTVDALSLRLGAKEGHLYERVVGLYKIVQRINDIYPADNEALLDLRQWWEGTGEYEGDYQH